MAHEVAHALVALRWSLRVRRITLWLLGGVSELGGSPPGPGVEVPVAVAGPLALTFFRKASGAQQIPAAADRGLADPNTAPATSCVTFLRIKNTTMPHEDAQLVPVPTAATVAPSLTPQPVEDNPSIELVGVTS